jgi:hypothetical protein
MAALPITKRTVDALESNSSEFTVWDDAVTGFGVRCLSDQFSKAATEGSVFVFLAQPL